MYEVIEEKGLDIAKIVIASSQFVQGEGLYKCMDCGQVSGPYMRSEQQLGRGEWEHRCEQCSGLLEYQWTATP